MTQTSMTTISDNEEPLCGNWKYPVVGDLLSPRKYEEIVHGCVGLRRHWHCLEKAKIAQKILGKGIVVVGSCKIWSADMRSNYGHDFNPPYEFHSWLQLSLGIIDVALPGTMEKGLNTYDEIGAFLTGREAFVLAGTPPKWIEYNVMEVVG